MVTDTVMHNEKSLKEPFNRKPKKMTNIVSMPA